MDRKTIAASVVLPLLGLVLKLINNKLTSALYAACYFIYIWGVVLILLQFNFYLFRKKTIHTTLLFTIGFAVSTMLFFAIHLLLYIVFPSYLMQFINRTDVSPVSILHITAFRALLLQCTCFFWVYFLQYKAGHHEAGLEVSRLKGYLGSINKEVKEAKDYKDTLLVSFQDRVFPVKTTEVAFILLYSGLVYCYLHSGKRYIINNTLDAVGQSLDPNSFFRANRQSIINRSAVKSVEQIENRKLKVHLLPASPQPVVVSKAKAAVFVKWLKQ